jgi:hypothetical protein
MAFLFRKPKKNHTQTRIVKHETADPKPETAREVRWQTHDLEQVQPFAPQRAAFTGFDSPPGRF